MPLHGTPRLREVLADVVATTRRLAVADLTDPGWDVDPTDPQLLGVRALAVAPVLQAGRVVGVVGAADTLSRPWSSEELAHLTELARVLGHDLANRTRLAAAERVVRGWSTVAVGLDGTTRAVGTLVSAADAGDDPALRARSALVRDRLDDLAEDVHRFEDALAPARGELAALAPVDLRWGVTAAVRAAARSAPDVRVRPRLHPEPLPVLADPDAVRAGTLALLDAVTHRPRHGRGARPPRARPRVRRRRRGRAARPSRRRGPRAHLRRAGAHRGRRPVRGPGPPAGHRHPRRPPGAGRARRRRGRAGPLGHRHVRAGGDAGGDDVGGRRRMNALRTRERPVSVDLAHGLVALGLFAVLLLAAHLRWAPRKEASAGGSPSD